MAKLPLYTIELNEPAPAIFTLDVHGNEINLESYKGKKVFIGFFRHAGCPFCNFRVHYLVQNIKRLKKLNLEMIFFFESPKELLLSSKFHNSLNEISLISDSQNIWYEQYGVQKSRTIALKSHFTSFFSSLVKAKLNKLPVGTFKGNESFDTIPAEFLIDQNGLVTQMHFAKNLTDRMSLDYIYQFCKSN